MITCKRCEFEVVETMRHSLIKNCCPSCGSALLGDLHMQRLRLLKSRILEQSFSQDLDEDLIFDITLFMLTEFFPSRTEEASSDDVQALPEEDVSGPDEDSVSTEGLEEFTDAASRDGEGDYDSIRDEVRSEILSKMDEEVEDVDLDLKVARLKRIAKEKAVTGMGPTVRRVTE
jgi:hypothetical protein